MGKAKYVDNLDDHVDKGDATAQIIPEGTLLADRALAHIRKMIATGGLAPGDRVNEMEIAAQIGVSRGPVREAIRKLASSGLVTSEPNQGARVVQIDIPMIRTLYEVRESLESMSAGLAAQRMTDSERAALLDMLDAHEARMREEGSNTYPAGAADWDFHLAILKGSRNEIAWRICGRDLRDLFSLLRARHSAKPGRGDQALLEHRWVAEAIRGRNADFAALLMKQHIRASRDSLFAMLAPARSTGDKEWRYDDEVA